MSRKYFKKFAADDILDIYKYLIKKRMMQNNVWI